VTRGLSAPSAREVRTPHVPANLGFQGLGAGEALRGRLGDIGAGFVAAGIAVQVNTDEDARDGEGYVTNGVRTFGADRRFSAWQCTCACAVARAFALAVALAVAFAFLAADARAVACACARAVAFA
jgi:hypothetical protein